MYSICFPFCNKGTIDGVPDTETLPSGLTLMKEVGLYNIIFEMDHGDAIYDFNKFPIDQYNAYLKKLITWVHDNLRKDAKVLFNLRDIMETLENHPERCLNTVKFLCDLPKELQLFGLIFEDSGKSTPEVMASATKILRKVMDDHDFKGRLLTHVHEKFGFKDASTLEVSAKCPSILPTLDARRSTLDA